MNRAILFAIQIAPVLEGEENKPFPWWLVLLILAIVFVIVIWALTHNAARTEVPHVEHQAAETAPAPVVPDDLKLIEGIGPKISSLMNEAGIFTFAQLADMPVAGLQAILDKAGLRLGDPATWPEQARLAAQGDLEGLQALQNSLKGGRKV